MKRRNVNAQQNGQRNGQQNAGSGCSGQRSWQVKCSSSENSCSETPPASNANPSAAAQLCIWQHEMGKRRNVSEKAIESGRKTEGPVRKVFSSSIELHMLSYFNHIFLYFDSVPVYICNECRICQEVAAMLLERGAWEQEDHKEEVLMHAEALQRRLTFQTT